MYSTQSSSLILYQPIDFWALTTQRVERAIVFFEKEVADIDRQINRHLSDPEGFPAITDFVDRPEDPSERSIRFFRGCIHQLELIQMKVEKEIEGYEEGYFGRRIDDLKHKVLSLKFECEDQQFQVIDASIAGINQDIDELAKEIEKKSPHHVGHMGNRRVYVVKTGDRNIAASIQTLDHFTKYIEQLGQELARKTQGLESVYKDRIDSTMHRVKGLFGRCTAYLRVYEGRMPMQGHLS